jgi:hypothetical protein
MAINPRDNRPRRRMRLAAPISRHHEPVSGSLAAKRRSLRSPVAMPECQGFIRHQRNRSLPRKMGIVSGIVRAGIPQASS